MFKINGFKQILNCHKMLAVGEYKKKEHIGINKVLIVGAGSIGSLIGLALIKAGLNVTFAGRANSKYTEQMKCNGLTIAYPSGEKYRISPLSPRVRFVDTQQELKETFELIVVAVKSNCLAEVCSYINSHTSEETILFHAQNGIPYWWFNEDNYLSSLNPTLANKLVHRPHLNSVDPEGMILAAFGDRCLLGCVIKAPCSKTEYGYIEVRKIPKMIIGLTNKGKYFSQEQKIKQLCQIFSTHGLDTAYSSNIRAEVCNKLAINTTTNILSALTGCLISELTANVYTNNLIKNILAEINKVFRVYGIKNTDLPTEEKLYAYINQPGSQKHLPSLAQDFAHHRQGEVSLITAPVEMANIADIDVPTLSSLAELLKLGQMYTLNSQDREFSVLGFDNTSGFYLLQEKIAETMNYQKAQLSDSFDYVIQINQSVARKAFSLVYS